MATNRETKSSSRATGTSGQGDKANGSADLNSASGSATTGADASSASGSRSGANGSAAKSGNGAANGRATGQGIAQGVLSGVKERVTSRVDEQKNRAADGLGGIADVFRTAGSELRMENETVAQYVEMAGDQLRRFADTIRQRGVADMLDDVHSFARQRPALFIGGAFILGIGVARFLKASAEREQMRHYGDNFSNVDPMTASTGQPSYSGDLEAGGY
ncbi:MAG TPA: hypothetical protein VEC39_06740 [Vicinamibacterales bacterium]|nr:hypothetical protein [Vicinamibacterales bacterium]